MHATNATRTIKTSRLAYAKGVNYNGDDAGVAITLDIRTGTCNTATINGKPSELTAIFEYGNQTYKGCAEALPEKP